MLPILDSEKTTPGNNNNLNDANTVYPSKVICLHLHTPHSSNSGKFCAYLKLFGAKYLREILGTCGCRYEKVMTAWRTWRFVNLRGQESKFQGDMETAEMEVLARVGNFMDNIAANFAERWRVGRRAGIQILTDMAMSYELTIAEFGLNGSNLI
jgi:hypothetical protein